MADNPYASLKVDLSGQTAVVTGASQGLGKAIAAALAAAGAKVACIARTRGKTGRDGERNHGGRRPGRGVSLRREGQRRGRCA